MPFEEGGLSRAPAELPLRTVPVQDGGVPGYVVSWALEGGDVNASRMVIQPSLPGEAEWVHPDAPGVWLGAPANGSLTSLLSFLTEADREHILRLYHACDQWSVAAARAVARIQLGRRLNCSPQDVVFVQGKHGKPMLDHRRHGAIARRLHFSISHSRELVGVAVAMSRIGVDVEPMREFPELMQVAASVFADEMLNDLAAAGSDAARRALFYRFWTLSEAISKATGEGVAQGLRPFAFSAHGVPVLTRADGPWGPCGRWSFGTLEGAKPRL
ncbi:4'-phosphopantetheinyl transferase family protein [Paraburkholderia domus]|jgi:Phosphopantetheinyl transferase|uniref:4'-phosphopantetheinyl transferase family protein n=1 Tax=Paraburkholderia domus TaxID=2793075 RepID=UPI001B01F4EF|nr:4'-phosphopantetheinyl transferase superfamily protein [Paraburkholderia domus]CAE6960869.1 hypothetical protein R70199_07310 [Paraburkholderia domus]